MSSARRRGVPVAWTLSATTLGLMLAIVVVALGALARDNVEALRADLRTRTLESARLVGQYAVSNLTFQQAADLDRMLASFTSDAEVDGVAVYGADGRLFARYLRPGAPAFAERSMLPTDVESAEFGPGSLEVQVPVLQGEERLGAVTVRVSTAPLQDRIDAYVRTVLGTGGVILLIAVLVVLLIRRLVVLPIEELARSLEVIGSTGDYAVRVPRPAGRELAALSDAFNEMLGAVELRQRQREMAEAQQRSYGERLRALRHMEAGIVEGHAPSVVAARAIEGLFRLVDSAWIAVVEVHEDEDGVTLLGWGRDGHVMAEAVPREAVRGLVLLVEAAGRGHAERGALPEIGADADDWRLGFGVPGLRWVLATPMVARGKLLGGLLAGRPEVEPFDKEVKQVIEDVAEILALAVQQARLTSEVTRHTQELERRVSIRTAQLAASNRELEGFAYSVAHDLRAPLRAMQGFSSALLEDYSDRLDDVGREFLERIAGASQRMDRLIRDLLDYSRLSVDALVLEPVRLDEVVDEVLVSVSTWAMERGVTLMVEVEPVVVWGHRASLSQMVTNLVTNGMKFVEPGKIPEVHLRTEPRHDRVRLWVEDNGIGIPAEYHERIFRVFERLHSVDAYPGTGIGLAIVKKGAERLGGTVGVDSEPGKGSRFYIELVMVV